MATGGARCRRSIGLAAGGWLMSRCRNASCLRRSRRRQRRTRCEQRWRIDTLASRSRSGVPRVRRLAFGMREPSRRRPLPAMRRDDLQIWAGPDRGATTWWTRRSASRRPDRAGPALMENLGRTGRLAARRGRAPAPRVTVSGGRPRLVARAGGATGWARRAGHMAATRNCAARSGGAHRSRAGIRGVARPLNCRVPLPDPPPDAFATARAVVAGRQRASPPGCS
jgi:hypothetical protein